MVFFASKHRVRALPLLEKIWIYPTAYALSFMAKGILAVVDRFDAAVLSRLAFKK
jgi:hypothetical protein